MPVQNGQVRLRATAAGVSAEVRCCRSASSSRLPGAPPRSLWPFRLFPAGHIEMDLHTHLIAHLCSTMRLWMLCNRGLRPTTLLTMLTLMFHSH